VKTGRKKLGAGGGCEPLRGRLMSGVRQVLGRGSGEVRDARALYARGRMLEALGARGVLEKRWEHGGVLELGNAARIVRGG
jgi:hypothetical protein